MPALLVLMLAATGLWASQIAYNTADKAAYAWWVAEELPDGDPLTNVTVARIYSAYPASVLEEVVRLIYRHDGNPQAAMHDPDLSERGRDALSRAVAAATPPPEPGWDDEDDEDDPGPYWGDDPVPRA